MGTESRLEPEELAFIAYAKKQGYKKAEALDAIGDGDGDPLIVLIDAWEHFQAGWVAHRRQENIGGGGKDASTGEA